MQKILTVCLGNICRSPMAQGILRKKISERGMDIKVDSAGTADYHVNEAPDPRSVETLLKYDNDISDLRGRQFITEDFDNFDLIIPMDEDNYGHIIKLARSKEDSRKVKMLMNYLYPGENISVPDPYFGGPEGFDRVYEMIDKATDKLLQDIQR